MHSFTGIACLQFASFFDTFGLSLFSKISKSSLVRRRKFLKETCTQVSVAQYHPILNLQANHFPCIFSCFGESDELRTFGGVPFFYFQSQWKLLQLKTRLPGQTSQDKLCTTHYCKFLLYTNCELSNEMPQSQTIPVGALPQCGQRASTSQQKPVTVNWQSYESH
jgi:hypothetical protein